MTEIEKFYNSLSKEVSDIQLSEENGESQEQAFTRVCLDKLSNVGETENPVVAYDEKGLGTRNQHKINGFAISENCETIDLFITIYQPSSIIDNIDKQSIDRACTRITNFFTKSYSSEYEKEVAETSSIFEFTHQLATSQTIKENLIRVNAFILTNGRYKGDIPLSKELGTCNVYYNVIDIDKLYRISEESRLPIQLNLDELGVEIPCMKIPVNADEYDAYLSYMPGAFLAKLYEQYGFKLLEQNVRSFLQFRTKINKGIRSTIMKRPHMFFAYNNGISATADSIQLDENGNRIVSISNLQIVNGGQTTATLFHVRKDAKENILKVLVPMKISVIKTEEDAYEIVKSISNYANTQNKINEADLSANDPKLVEIEKLSRYMLTPITIESNEQHYWFFDRISKQYDNLYTQANTKSKKKAFELKYPKSCKFTKYELAKYYNSYYELIENDKILIGPHSVVDGNETNFRAFRDYILPDLEVNSTFYEDIIAKAILFKSVDKRHGTKRSKTPPIGDMKQVMVPYSISLLKIATKGRLDLGKIWKNQKLSDELSDYMYNLMVKLNQFLKDNTPRSNIIEWATKEDCWKTVKEKFEIPDINPIKADIADPELFKLRYSSQEENQDTEQISLEYNLIKAIGSKRWTQIAEWGKDSGCLDLINQNLAKNISHKLQYDYEIQRRDVVKAMTIYEIVCKNNYELFQHQEDEVATSSEIDQDLISKMISWGKVFIILGDWEIKILQQSIRDKKYSNLRVSELLLILKRLKDCGFE